MKKLAIAAIAVLSASALSAQPQLTADNIDEIIAAMTLEEKATLCVGGARASMVEGVTSGMIKEVPGAAGNTRPMRSTKKGRPLLFYERSSAAAATCL